VIGEWVIGEWVIGEWVIGEWVIGQLVIWRSDGLRLKHSVSGDVVIARTEKRARAK